MSNRAAVLESLITQAQDEYYNKGSSGLTDAEYDQLVEELRLLNSAHPLVTRVGAPLPKTSVFHKVKHDRPMGSLLKVSGHPDLVTWANKYVPTGVVCWSEKLDGFSLSLVYKKGHLLMAVSRGAGDEGENITANILKMKGVPTTIPHQDDVYVRAEAICHLQDWAVGFPGDKNPRNSIAGAARRLDGAGCEFGTLMAHDVVGPDFVTEIEKFEFLRSMGFVVAPYGHCPTSEIIGVAEAYVDVRPTLPYQIDGLVFRENNVQVALDLGTTDNRPRAHRAFKFEAEGAETTLESVTWQVGRTGVCTPVAEVTPVDIGGVMVSRVMLNNIEYIQALGLEIGCGIRVIRANDVIPKTEAKTAPGTSPIEYPNNCPVCGTQTEVELPLVLCPSFACPAQSLRRVAHYLKILGVKGLGDSTLEKLIESDLVKTPRDLYDLSPLQVEAKLGVSAKVLGKALSELVKKSQNLPTEKFVASFGIVGFSESFAALALSALGSFEALQRATESDLCAVAGIGPHVASCAVAGLAQYAEAMAALLGGGLITLAKPKEAAPDGPLSGTVWAFTGFRDASLETTIQRLGGVIGSGVTKKTTHLVCAEAGTQSVKAKKARESGVAVLDSKNILDFLNQVG